MKSLISILRQKLFKAHKPTATPPPREQPPTDNQAASFEPAAVPLVDAVQADNKPAPPSAAADVMAMAKANPQAQLIVVPFGFICPMAVSVTPSSAYTVFALEGCNNTQRNVAAIADNVDGLRRMSIVLQTAAQLIVIARQEGDQSETDLFFDLLNRVRGNRADHIPMQFPEAHRLLMLAIESVSTAAAKGGEA